MGMWRAKAVVGRRISRDAKDDEVDVSNDNEGMRQSTPKSGFAEAFKAVRQLPAASSGASKGVPSEVI